MTAPLLASPPHRMRRHPLLCSTPQAMCSPVTRPIYRHTHESDEALDCTEGGRMAVLMHHAHIWRYGGCARRRTERDDNCTAHVFSWGLPTWAGLWGVWVHGGELLCDVFLDDVCLKI